jgi:hypothetical protein
VISASARPARDFERQTRLAHAALALDQHDRSRTSARGRELGIDLVEDRVAPDQRRPTQVRPRGWRGRIGRKGCGAKACQRRPHVGGVRNPIARLLGEQLQYEPIEQLWNVLDQ